MLLGFSHNQFGAAASIYSVSPLIFLRYLGVGMYLGSLLGISECVTRVAGRNHAPAVYAVVGAAGLLRYYVIDGYPSQLDLIYVFFTFPDDGGTGITCLIIVWFIIMGIIRRFQNLSVTGGALVESLVISAFILAGLSNRWLSENHYALFSSALSLWAMLFTILFCQRRDNGI